jgi:RNA polymerase sigma-70 factor (ECF subfamily)
MNPAQPRDESDLSSNPAAEGLPDPAHSLVLLERAQSGDKQALDELIRRYEPRVRRIVRARLPAAVAAKTDAADLVQITLLAALPQLSGFRPQGAASLLNWLATIATSRIRDEWDRFAAGKRDAGREYSIEAMDSGSSSYGWQPAARERTPSMELFRKELEEMFDAAVHELPDDQREVVILRDYCGYDWADIADQLSRATLHAARQLHQRAWIALRRSLGPRLRSSM